MIAFSQGVSTASRWVLETSHTIAAFIMIAGEIAIEMQQQLPPKLSIIPKAFYKGSNDSLIRPEKVEMMTKLLSGTTAFGVFEGKHEINSNCVKMITDYIANLNE